MQFLKIIYLLIILKFYFVYCSPIANKNSYSKYEEPNTTLEAKISELMLENARLKLEIIQLRLECGSASTIKNCTSVLDPLTNFSICTLWEDVKSFKKYFDNVLVDFFKKDLNPKCSPADIEVKEILLPKNCAEAANGKSSVYTIELPKSELKSFPVVCDAETQMGGWTIIQQRVDGSIDFFRPWSEYKIGFGTVSVHGEYFIGLEKLHQMTATEPYELLIVLKNFNNTIKYANYNSFAIASEAELYELKELGTYSGTAGDSLSIHKGMRFSTHDKDNDKIDGNCALGHKGAWWYNKCHESNLNGKYYSDGYTKHEEGIVWYHFHNQYFSLKAVKMMIRPKHLNAVVNI